MNIFKDGVDWIDQISCECMISAKHNLNKHFLTLNNK